MVRCTVSRHLVKYFQIYWMPLRAEIFYVKYAFCWYKIIVNTASKVHARAARLYVRRISGWSARGKVLHQVIALRVRTIGGEKPAIRVDAQMNHFVRGPQTINEVSVLHAANRFEWPRKVVVSNSDCIRDSASTSCDDEPERLLSAAKPDLCFQNDEC